MKTRKMLKMISLVLLSTLVGLVLLAAFIKGGDYVEETYGSVVSMVYVFGTLLVIGLITFFLKSRRSSSLLAVITLLYFMSPSVFAQKPQATKIGMNGVALAIRYAALAGSSTSEMWQNKYGDSVFVVYKWHVNRDAGHTMWRIEYHQSRSDQTTYLEFIEEVCDYLTSASPILRNKNKINSFAVNFKLAPSPFLTEDDVPKDMRELYKRVLKHCMPLL